MTLWPLAWSPSAVMEASSPMSCPVPSTEIVLPEETTTSVEIKVKTPLFPIVKSPVSW